MASNSIKWNQRVNPFHIKHGKRDLNGNPTELGPMLIRSRFIHTRFYGSSAPVFNPSTLSCTSSNSEIQFGIPHWIKTLEASNGLYGLVEEMYAEWIRERWDYKTGTENEMNYLFGSTCKAQNNGLRVFGGRCLSEASRYHRTHASDTKSPECLENANAWEPTELSQLQGNGNFRAILESRKADVGAGCDPGCKNTTIPTKEDILKEGSRSTLKSSLEGQLEENPNKYISRAYGCANRKNETDRNMFGLCSISEAGQAVYGVRQWHGFVMLFSSVIIIPMQCFIARYFKGPIPISPETGDPYIPVRPWYIVCRSFIDLRKFNILKLEKLWSLC